MSLPILRGLAFFLALTFSLCLHARPADEKNPPWDFATETSEGIKIWTRQLPHNPVKDFRAQMTVDVPLDTALAAITDVNSVPQWFWHMEEVRLLEGATLDDAYLYLALDGVWPVASRDVVVRATVGQNPKTLAVSIVLNSVPGRVPLVKDHVRMPQAKAWWTLTPLSPTQTQLEMIGNADPGGHIPLWLANKVVTVMPKESFRNLRKHLVNPRYRDLEALYAQNPMLRELMGRIRLP